MCCSQLYDYQIDVWSLGCIVAECFGKRPIFAGNNYIEQLQWIFHILGTPKDLSWITAGDAKQWTAAMPQKQAVNFNQLIPNGSTIVHDFIAQMLIINPHKRPNISTVIKHEWLKEFIREKDYKKCPAFNISFEYESSINTEFGVRHMMFEELRKFDKLCTEQQQEQTHSEQKQNEHNGEEKKRDEMPKYFIQVTCIDELHFHLEIQMFHENIKDTMYWIKDKNNKKIKQQIVIKKGHYTTGIDMLIDATENECYDLGLYESKDSIDILSNSNPLKFMTIKSDFKI